MYGHIVMARTTPMRRSFARELNLFTHKASMPQAFSRSFRLWAFLRVHSIFILKAKEISI
jgi:hypothetical protein